MVLTQRQIYGSMEHNRETRNKPTHLWSINLRQRSKNIQWRKDSLFSKWCWESWTASHKSRNLEHSITSYTKISSKWFKDLNIRYDTIKLLEENISRTFSDINYSSIFLHQSPNAKEIKAK